MAMLTNRMARVMRPVPPTVIERRGPERRAEPAHSGHW